MKNTKNKRYTKQEIRRNTFDQIPHFIRTDDEYKQLSCEARCVYSLLRNRHDLSMKNNGWENKAGEVYIVYPREELAKELNISVPTVVKAMKQLRELNLIEEQVRGFNKPNLIFVTFVDIDTYIPPEYVKKEENKEKEDTTTSKEEKKNDEGEQTTGDFSPQNEELFNSGVKDPLTQEEEKTQPETRYSSLNEKSFNSRLKDFLIQELKDFKCNQKDLKKTYSKKTNYQSYLSIIDDIIDNIKNMQTTELLKKLKKIKNLIEGVKEVAEMLKILEEAGNENTFQNIKEEPVSHTTSQKSEQTDTEDINETVSEHKNENNSTEQKDAEQQKKESTKTYTESHCDDTLKDAEEEPVSHNANSQENQENQETNTEDTDKTAANEHQEESTKYTRRQKKKNKRKKTRQQKKEEPNTEKYNEYREIISRNIDFEAIKGDDAMIPELYEIMVDTVCTEKPYIKISGDKKPAESVRSRLLKLDQGHIKYVVECLRGCTTKIINIKAYMLTTLFNSYSTIDTYYANQVMHDLYGDKDNNCA